MIMTLVDALVYALVYVLCRFDSSTDFYILKYGIETEPTAVYCVELHTDSLSCLIFLNSMSIVRPCIFRITIIFYSYLFV